MNLSQFKNTLLNLRVHIAALFLLLPISQAAFAQEEELLEPEKAFAFSAKLVDGEIKAQWVIADGYYMYRDKFSYTVKEGAAILGEISFPKGKIKSDPAFGDVEVYVHKAIFTMPVSDAGSDNELTLVAKGQGCNEPIGVCYPPIKYDIPLSLANILMPTTSAQSASPELAPAMDLIPVTDPSADSDLNSLSDLRSMLGVTPEEDELLPPDEAFKATLTATEDGRIVADMSIADGYYAYRSKFKFSTEDLGITNIQFPKGKLKHDDYFGEVEVYRFNASIPLLTDATQALAGKTIELYTEYQGCADMGVCYPPIKKTVLLTLPALINNAVAATMEPENIAPSAAPIAVSAVMPTTGVAIDSDEADDKGLWSLLLGAFLGGILLTFTPCVLPMIPILSSVIAGQGEQITKGKAGWLAVVYVLGTAVTYAAMGWIAGATGDQLQAYFQNAWALGILAAIFVLMSLAMFGLYEIQMPSFVQSRLQEKSMGLKGGSTPMVFVLGLISALVVGACVSPVLISFLGLAITRGDPILGAGIMFVMALGMGIPLILLGLGAGHVLPKAGMWMDKVKYVFGVMLLGIAIYMLGILPAVPVLLLWAVLFIVVGVYLGATQTLPESASGWQMLNKGLGTVLLLWGVLSLIGGIYGQRDPLHPLPEQMLGASSSATTNSIESHLFTRIDNSTELDAQFTTARQSGKLVMIDYYADWCTDCVRMEKSTFIDPAVRAEMDKRFIALQVDVTDPNDENRKALKKRFGVFGPPAVLFFDAQNQQIKSASFYGYKKPSEFLAHIQAL